MRRRFTQLMMLAMLASVAACNGSKTTVIEQAPQVTAANELAALTRLQAIGRAEMAYQAESAGQYATLDELIKRGMVNDPSQGKLTGYKFDLRVTAHGFAATATPERYGVSGKRSFYTDEQNVMRGADKQGSPASAADPQAQSGRRFSRACCSRCCRKVVVRSPRVRSSTGRRASVVRRRPPLRASG